MDVFVIPVGQDRYELYCEPQPLEAETESDLARAGFVSRLRQRFNVMLRAAEERQRGDAAREQPKGWLGRLHERMMAWIVERIAEQRLLWNLRRVDAAVAVHPPDMTFDQVMTIIRRDLQRDYERHRRWLVVDTIFFIASGVVAIVPGPNLIAYYFAFRVVGHWLSMRGAINGLQRVRWTGRECPPLGELREVVTLEPQARDQRIHDIASRLRLQHLSTFFDRVAVRHA